MQTESGQPLSTPSPGQAAPTEGSLGLRQSLFVGGIDDIDDAMALGIVLGEGRKRGLSPGHLATQGRSSAARPSWYFLGMGRPGGVQVRPKPFRMGVLTLERVGPAPALCQGVSLRTPHRRLMVAQGDGWGLGAGASPSCLVQTG